ncbi:hypothetical protein DRJ25_04130 [Candidatus Woesearchaeota archaeon]|nr:MAG: hypothetical protein DRJ25_04130 [Candidatus Woesearchaeota archaeon]
MKRRKRDEKAMSKEELAELVLRFAEEREIDLTKEYSLQDAAGFVEKDFYDFKQAYTILFYKVDFAKLTTTNPNILGAETIVTGLEFVLSYLGPVKNKKLLKETKDYMQKEIIYRKHQ